MLRIARTECRGIVLHRPPERGDILLQLARDQVTAVQSQVAKAFGPAGGEQSGRPSRRAIGDHGPGRRFVVPVGVADQELAERDPLDRVLPG